MRRFFRKLKRLLVILLVLALLGAAALLWKDRFLAALGFAPEVPAVTELTVLPAGSIPVTGIPIPAWEGEPFTELSGNVPGFGREGLRFEECYAHFSELDSLGRAGPAMACIGVETMPTVQRESVDSSLHPSGWHNAVYDGIIEDRFLYNRCHILGWQLCGDSGDIHNLFTGTRYLNVEGMLPFENQVAQHLREMGGHVLYRAVPRYEGKELVPRGIELEAWSLEDQGRGLCFHVFVHNVQPGVIIDYATGESRAA